ncbi:IS5 family transposase [Dysgonomonas sp. 511]|uniref:IS5 family transposase n=1 Tax=Dysgonomonas sp. 511 TaxID=2302930 RepID=UPI0021042A9D|nr:IS5 family transposase [Dysgonomonas sp. 511]
MRFSSQGKQLSLDIFRSSLSSLDKSNRWVQLGDSLPWDEIERLYNSRLNNGKRGAGNKPARMIIGSLIIKHKMNLSDEETILMIQENPYMQYFLGLSEFTDKPIFDPSLFVSIRKRLGVSDFNDMSVSLLQMQVEKAKTEKGKDTDNDDSDAIYTSSNEQEHQGSLKVDATCCDAEVRYPTDIDLLHDGCKVIHRYTYKLCTNFNLPLPPGNYSSARKAYLEVIKRKKKSKSLLRKGKSQLLTYLIRNVRGFINLIAVNGTHLLNSLKHNERKTIGAILKMYHQQEEMFKSGCRSCPDRIVSIFQPHIRPIVRGKSKSSTEFGAKIGASIVNGYTFLDHHSWDSYNESADLTLQIELYRKRFGFLPRRIYADKIYMNKENRRLMKELGIQMMGKPLGRPPKISQSKEAKEESAKTVGQRNEIEATFGTGKRIYRANNIRAKLPQTAECWTAMCFFVKNVMKFLREFLYDLFSEIILCLNLKRDTRIISPPRKFILCGENYEGIIQ